VIHRICLLLPGLMSLVLSVCVSTTSAQTQPPPVYAVLFTHIEDNTPAGLLGTQQSQQNYLLYRGKLIAVANLCLSYNVRWSLQPDWKFLLAALQYEDSSLIATTNGKNLLHYLKEDLNVAIDPHSHEQQGYNYTDVAHLLDSLGVGGSTVIGGHIWDPRLPQFQQWDRFRVPVPGSRYPSASWRGDILMGSGTPNHVNDPLISGVWRPRDRFNYFVDDPAGNIASVGQYKGDVSSALELINLYASGAVPSQFMLTASIHIKPATIIATNGLSAIEDSVLIPLVALRDSGKVKLTDFTSLISDWRTLFGSSAYLYDPNSTVRVDDHPLIPHELNLYQNYPNPFSAKGRGTFGNPSTVISFQLAMSSHVTLKVFDMNGREVATLVDGEMEAGNHAVPFAPQDLAGGIYFYKLTAGKFSQTRKAVLVK
jgi:hypothetical protein